MNVFLLTDYREVLRESVRLSKERGEKISYAQLADTANVQRSYLTNVMKGRNELNSDQLFLVGKALGFSRAEQDYVGLLLDIERCQTKERRARLVEQREQLRRSALDSAKYLQSEPLQSSPAVIEFYMNVNGALALMLLQNPIYQRSTSLLAKQLGLGAADMRRVLANLKELGCIRQTDNEVRIIKNAVHLDRDSPLARVHAILFRVRAIERQQSNVNARDYFFTATVSGSTALREALHSRFLDTLKWLAEELKGAPDEEIFQVNFDLFSPLSG